MVPLWVCDSGQSEIFWQPETEDVRLVLQKPDAIAAIRASMEQEACSENYYSPTHDLICLKKSLANTTHWDGEALVIEGLKRWSFGADWQFLSGQYRPSIQPSSTDWIVHLHNAGMANSKTLIQWDNGPVTLQNCAAVNAYPATPLTVQVLADAYSEGQLQSLPLSQVTLYAGDWHANQILGTTDSQGWLRLNLEAGTQAFSVFKMTSSHSALWSDPVTLDLSTRHPNSLTIHVAPTTVRITTQKQLAYGRALYITGEGTALGDWQTAQRFTPSDNGWELVKNLPIGARYKILESDWSPYPFISTSSPVRWELGPDHVIPPKDGYYEVVIRAEPRFD